MEIEGHLTMDILTYSQIVFNFTVAGVVLIAGMALILFLLELAAALGRIKRFFKNFDEAVLFLANLFKKRRKKEE